MTPAAATARDLTHLRRRLNRGLLDPALKAVLDANDADWSANQLSLRWNHTLRDYTNWVKEHGKPPKRSSYDQYEASLAQWMTKQRGSRKLTPEQAEALHVAIPGWRLTQKTEAFWVEKLIPVASWIAERHRFPSENSEDPTERAHFRWADSQRRNHALSARKRELLLQYIPSWNVTRVSDAAWDNWLDGADQWVRANSRKPLYSREDAEERRHAAWLTRQRAADSLGMLSETRRLALNAKIPGWNVTRLTIARSRRSEF
jgi:hypothetical protein